MISPEFLGHFAGFTGADEAVLKKIAMVSEERHVPQGEFLFHEGQPADELYFILKGGIDLKTVVGNGERVIVDNLVGGDLVAWSAVVEPHKLSLDGFARKNTDVIAIDAAELRELLVQHPDFGFRFMSAVAQTVSQRLVGARLQLTARS